MATLTSKLTLSSTALTSDVLSFTVISTDTVVNTTGLKRKTLTSESKTNLLFINDGDGAVADVTSREGKFLDITDNHGLRKRYVFTTADGSGVATGVIIVQNTDTGGTTSPDSSIVGGTAVQIDNGDTENAILAKLVIGINHANGHDGSITATAPATAANGAQSSTFTNPTTGEGATFFIDNANATWQDINSATNSASDHEVLVDKNEYASPAFVYIKNTSDYHTSNNIVKVYYDNLGADDIMEIRGGQFAFLPLNPLANLRAYTSTSGTIVEFMVTGTEA